MPGRAKANREDLKRNRSFGPGGPRCKNTWSYEGWVGKVERVETKGGRRMSKIDVSDRPLVGTGQRRHEGFPLWVRAIAFDDHAEDLLNFEPGERVLLRGNLYNKPRFSRFNAVHSWVVTEARSVEGSAPRTMNEWNFEGKIARPPNDIEKSGLSMTAAGIWQPGLPIVKDGKVRMTQPIIINPLAFTPEIRRQTMQFDKGDGVYASGHMQLFIRKGSTQLIIDRILPLDREWIEKQQGKKAMAILADGLEEGLLEL